MRKLIVFSMVGAVAASVASSAGAAWCTEGSGRMLAGSKEGPAADIEFVLKNCKPGDTIGIPGNTTVAIGTLCDFTKAIYHAPNGLAVCVLKSKQ